MANNTGNLIGSINRNFRGFGREIFSDTGQYVLRMDAASPETTNIKNSNAVRYFPHRQEQLAFVNPFGRKETISVEEFKRRLKEMPVKEDAAHRKRFLKLVEKGYRETGSVQPDGTHLVAVQRSSGDGLTLDQRAVMLATAVSIDFDYFSRHSGYKPPWPQNKFEMRGG
jgi:hypothetical protein